MHPEIFYLSKDYCCLACGDYLVINMPVKEIDLCLRHIEMGKKYKYPRWFERFYAKFMNGLNQEGGSISFYNGKTTFWNGDRCVSKFFVLDKRFWMLVRDEGGSLRLRRGLQIIEGCGKRASADVAGGVSLDEWLKSVLEKRDFIGLKRPVPQKYYWGTWGVITTMVLVFCYIGIHKIGNPFNLNKLIMVSMVAFAFYLVISILITYCFATRGDMEILYVKNPS